MPPMIEAFVLHFGEMGSRWGINRTVGQIYALLVVSEAPLNAETIAETLGISRSNVSMSLKELGAWRLIRSQHQRGDRREYYSAPEDVWEIARTLIEERRKRELDPTLTVLRDLLLEAPASSAEAHARERMGQMLELLELAKHGSEEVQRLSLPELRRLLKLGSRMSGLLDARDALAGRRGKTGQ